MLLRIARSLGLVPFVLAVDGPGHAMMLGRQLIVVNAPWIRRRFSTRLSSRRSRYKDKVARSFRIHVHAWSRSDPGDRAAGRCRQHHWRWREPVSVARSDLTPTSSEPMRQAREPPRAAAAVREQWLGARPAKAGDVRSPGSRRNRVTSGHHRARLIVDGALSLDRAQDTYRSLLRAACRVRHERRTMGSSAGAAVARRVPGPPGRRGRGVRRWLPLLRASGTAHVLHVGGNMDRVCRCRGCGARPASLIRFAERALRGRRGRQLGERRQVGLAEDGCLPGD